MTRDWDSIDKDACTVILICNPLFAKPEDSVDVMLAAAIGSIVALHESCEEVAQQMADAGAPERMLHAIRQFAEQEIQREVNQILERN